jgi:hypothetical protein
VTNDLIAKHKKALKVSIFWQNVLSSFIGSMQIHLPMQKAEVIDNKNLTKLRLKYGPII